MSSRMALSESPPPAPISRRRACRNRAEAQKSCSSPPFRTKKRKADVSPSAPLKRLRGNEIAALFFRDPYDAAIDRERAASVAAALEHAFWSPKSANGEGVDELKKIEDYLIAMTGDKLAKLYPL